MNKASIAAGILCCLLVGGTIGCSAQSNPPGAVQAQAQAGRGEKALERLTTALSLTPDQVAQIKPILEASRSKAMQIRNDSTLTDDQKKAAIKDLRRQQAEQIKPILTAQQIATWKAMVAKRRTAQQGTADQGG